MKSLGATHVVDRNSDVLSEVKKITSEPIEIVLDTIGTNGTQEQGWDLAAPGGTFAVTLPPTVDAKKYGDKHIVHIFGGLAAHGPLGPSFYKNVPRLLESGALKVSRLCRRI